MLVLPGYRWAYKPPLGREINWSHPQAAGMRLCLLLNEFGGPPFDLAQRKLATVTGAPTWTSTPYGPARNGYGTGAYDALDPAQQILCLTGAYPSWFAFGLITSTNTAQQHPGGAGHNAGTNAVAMLGLNQNNAGQLTNGLTYFCRGTSGTDGSVYTTGRTECTDGGYHVFACVSLSVSSRELWCDGVRIGTSALSTGSLAMALHTVGVRRRTTVDLPFLGSVLWHMAGNGQVPDMKWLAQEPYAAIQPPSTRRYFAFGSFWTITPGGILSARTEGAITLAPTVAPAIAGVLSAEAEGAVSLAPVATIAGAGVLSAELEGSLAIAGTVALAGAGILSGQILGAVSLTAAIGITVTPAGILSAEKMGATTLALATSLAPHGITDDELVGLLQIDTIAFGAPEDILSAVVKLFAGSASSVAITGGMYTEHVPSSDILPYATVTERSSHEEMRTSDSVTLSVELCFRVYAANLDLAGRLGDKLKLDMLGKTPSFTGPKGVTPLIGQVEPKHTRETGRVQGAQDGWYQDRTLRCRVIRSIP